MRTLVVTAKFRCIIKLNDKFSAHTVSSIINIEAFTHKGGRPYDGLGVLWSKNKNIGVKVIDIDFLHGCMAVELQFENVKYACVAFYLPVFENTDEYEEDILLCTSFIDVVASQFTCDLDVNFLIVEDFNFNMNRLLSNKRLQILCDLFNELSLSCCDNMEINEVGYTYKHEALGTYSYFDHIFVQENRLDTIVQFAVLDDGNNCSDHCALNVIFKSNLSQSTSGNANLEVPLDSTILWNIGDVNAYKNLCSISFDTVLRPVCCNCMYPSADCDHISILMI